MPIHPFDNIQNGTPMISVLKLSGGLMFAANALFYLGAAESADAPSDDSSVNAKIGFDRSTGKYGQDTDTVASVASLALTYNVGDYAFDLV